MIYVVENNADSIPNLIVPFEDDELEDAKKLCDKIAQENDSTCLENSTSPYGCYFGSDSCGVWLIKQSNKWTNLVRMANAGLRRMNQ